MTRQYRFAASHRLHAAELGEDENRLLYGKCNNPYGHGHNYVVDVSVQGPLDKRAGRVVDIQLLDRLVAKQVLEPFEHRNLNKEVARFETLVPTSENLAAEICRRLKSSWSEVFPGEWPKLEKIRIGETPRNIFEVETDEIE
jgi:6-pyruvoyltetrahydropterin/6-carboxytetrahydropterin synthase